MQSLLLHSLICSFPSNILPFNVSVTAKNSATAGTERGQPGQQALTAIQLPVAELQKSPEICASSQEQSASAGWEIQSRRRDLEPDRQTIFANRCCKGYAGPNLYANVCVGIISVVAVKVKCRFLASSKELKIRTHRDFQK